MVSVLLPLLWSPAFTLVSLTPSSVDTSLISDISSTDFLDEARELFFNLFFSCDLFLAAALKSFLLLNVGLDDAMMSGGADLSGDDDDDEADADLEEVSFVGDILQDHYL